MKRKSTILLMMVMHLLGQQPVLAGAPALDSIKDSYQSGHKLSDASSIAVDDDGNIYVSNESGKIAVEKISRDGLVEVLMTRNKKNEHRGLNLAASLSGEVFLSQRSDKSILKYSNGQWIALLDKTGKIQIDGPLVSARINKPGPIAVNSKNEIYFFDSKTLRKIKNGRVSTISGNEKLDAWNPESYKNLTKRIALFITPMSLAVTDDNSSYVLDYGMNNDESQGVYYQQFVELDDNGGYFNVFNSLGVAYWVPGNNDTWSGLFPVFDEYAKTFKKEQEPAFENYLSIAINKKRHLILVTDYGKIFFIDLNGDQKIINTIKIPRVKKFEGLVLQACTLDSNDITYCITKDRMVKISNSKNISYF